MEKITQRLDMRLAAPLFQHKAQEVDAQHLKSVLLKTYWEGKTYELDLLIHFKGERKLSYQWGADLPNGPLPAIVDVFFQLIQGKGFFGIHRVFLREIENFLRDENHRPVFEINQKLQEFFDELKFNLLKTLISNSGGGLNFTDGLKLSPKLSLMKKIKGLKELLDITLNDFLKSEGHQLELVALIKNRVYIKSEPSLSVDQEAHGLANLVEEIINSHFGGATPSEGLDPDKDDQYLKVYLE